MPLTLRWSAATRLMVEAEGLLPPTLAPLSAAGVGGLRLPVGNATAEVGELFGVEGDAGDGTVFFEGDLRSVRGIGRGLGAGTVLVRGEAGAELGAGMTGGTIEVEGSAGDYAGAEMRGGLLRIRGTAGRHLGAAYPGSRLGMREGMILVEGSIGDYAGLAMRRGLIAVSGPAGDGLGRAMIAGSIFAFGPVGPRAGAGMKRGTIALFGYPEPGAFEPLSTFAPAGRFRPHVLTLYLRRLRDRGFPVPGPSFSGRPERYNGDLVEGGRGEVLVWSRTGRCEAEG